eukprot:11163668-Alexandrium_andersonii.AAC.1
MPAQRNKRGSKARPPPSQRGVPAGLRWETPRAQKCNRMRARAGKAMQVRDRGWHQTCLLYTSDAADDM